MEKTMNPFSPKVLSGYKDIANYLGVSRRTLYRHIKSLPVSRLGNKIVILESDLIYWIQVKTRANLQKNISIRRTVRTSLNRKKG